MTIAAPIATPRPGEPLHHHDPSAAANALREMEHEHRVELDELKRRRVLLYAAGRVLVAALFIVSALAKWADYHATVLSMWSVGINDAGMVLPFAIGLELVGGAMLAAGWKTRASAAVMAVYVGFLTLLVHNDLS